jgi:cyclic patellamide precursor peptide PatG
LEWCFSTVANLLRKKSRNDGQCRGNDHRALNYYALSGYSFSLTGIDVLASPLSGTRKIVDCIFSYTNRNTYFTEKLFVHVDVSDESW